MHTHMPCTHDIAGTSVLPSWHQHTVTQHAGVSRQAPACRHRCTGAGKLTEGGLSCYYCKFVVTVCAVHNSNGSFVHAVRSHLLTTLTQYIPFDMYRIILYFSPLFSFRWHKTGQWSHEWTVIQRYSGGVPWRWVDWCVWWQWLGCGRCSSGLCQAGLQPGSCANMDYLQCVFKVDVCSEMCGEWVISGIPTPNYTVIHCVVPEQWIHTLWNVTIEYKFGVVA